MKRIFCLLLTFVSVLALVSCDSKKKDEKPLFEEEVSKEIKAEEGGKVESSDGKTSIDIPAGALDADTTITMRIFDAEDYAGTEGKKVISKVVEFEPTGTVFKKPVIISMVPVTGNAGLRAPKRKVVTAAVYREEKGKWSYSPTGVAVKVEYAAGGDPIMKTAAGDPIMLNAAGDPIMQSDGSMLSAAGDPIMVTATGDPIMANAAGDPIMNSAAGDPIMMTTGHFTAYAFMVVDTETEEKPVEENDDDEPVTDDEDETEDDAEIPDIDEDTEPDEDVIPEPDPVYSTVLCTGLSICADDTGLKINCPNEGEDFYGQDAQYAARRACVRRSYTALPKPEEDSSPYKRVKDNVTGLTWLITSDSVSFADKDTACSAITYMDTEWRLPTPKELLSIADNEYLYGSAIDPIYFETLYGQADSHDIIVVWTDSAQNVFYDIIGGYTFVLSEEDLGYLSDIQNLLVCVSGEKYGEVKSEDYEIIEKDGDKMVRDSSTGLIWQKDSVSGNLWKEALEYCENLSYGGYTDWRLPNKNELITLFDYSKQDGIMSSFPDIQEELLWSSTSQSHYSNATLEHFRTAWLVRTDGEFDYRDIFNGWEDHADDIHTRCVRSDLAEKTDLPDCDETGVAPCKDSYGTIWSSKIYVDMQEDKSIILTYDAYRGVSFDDIADLCRSVNENGSNNWRLPTIDEIRGIAVTETLKKEGGTCGVTTQCTDSTPEAGCYVEESCDGDTASKSILNDFGVMFSCTLDGDGSWDPWGVYFRYDELAIVSASSVGELTQRCVLDPSLGYKKTPYTDPATGLEWSNISPTFLQISGAITFCEELNEKDPGKDWRLPTILELKKLIKGCPESNCSPDVTGKYSIFGDVVALWSSDTTGENNDSEFIDFSSASENSASWYGRAKVRCVSGDTGE